MDFSILLTNPELASSVKIEITGRDLVALTAAVVTSIKAKTHTEEETYLTQAEVIDLVRRDRTTLSRWHNKGVLQHNAIGLYRKSEVINLLNKK